MTNLPDNPVILFAHAAYQMRQRFEARNTGLRAIEAVSRPELQARAGEADVIVVSGLWDNAILEAAPRLRLVQPISAGVDQYDQAAFRRTGVRLASAQGVNANAVSDQAMALVLSLARLFPQARDNQAKHHWRGMIGNIPEREDELPGKTMLVVGLGRIGGRLARLGKAFGMTVIGLRRDPAAGGEADSVRAMSDLKAVLPQADFVVLTCPLTPETTGADRRRGPFTDEADCAAGERCPRARGGRAGADRSLAPRRHRWCRAGLRGGGAVAGQFAAVGHAGRPQHAPHGRRNPGL